jgi:ABC-type nitrate/sulfonate/bicarbonate transport system ATPase subunit
MAAGDTGALAALTAPAASLAGDSATRPRVGESMVEIRGVSKVFRRRGFAPVPAIDRIDLDVRRNEFVSIVGPSGCGKSTLFNIIAGIERPSAGRVVIDGTDATGRPGLVSYMFQKDLLLPWRSVLDNITLGLELGGTPRGAARRQAAELADRYGLRGFEDRFPSTLSGGMRQRAALLRTLLFNREILLLDEPFGALDALTRATMQELLLRVFDDVRRTIVFVTHDVEEAIYLSDVVYVLSARPAVVHERVAVPLSRPRTRAMRAQPACVELKARLLEMLYAEADLTAERPA